MRVRITKVGESLFDGEARSLTLSGSEGEMTILPHHAPLISPLRKGMLSITTATDVKTFAIEKGLVEVSNNEVIVLL